MGRVEAQREHVAPDQLGGFHVPARKGLRKSECGAGGGETLEARKGLIIKLILLIKVPRVLSFLAFVEHSRKSESVLLETGTNATIPLLTYAILKAPV